jgi:hypothetical protein
LVIDVLEGFERLHKPFFLFYNAKFGSVCPAKIIKGN